MNAMIWMSLWLACDTQTPDASEEAGGAAAETTDEGTGTGTEADPEDEVRADVVGVAVSGAAGKYTFAVTVKSPDTNCALYADWWEVLSVEGELLYRRILNHSHASEQPFTRTGGPVPIPADQEVLVRAHLSPGGYGGLVMRGRPDGDFAKDEEHSGDAQFAAPVGQQDPQPTICAY